MRGSRIPETRGARVLRRSQTHAETVLWRALRGRSLDGLKLIFYTVNRQGIDYKC